MSDQVRQPDYFARFGITPTFELDEQQLTAGYYALQRQYHPDRLEARPEIQAEKRLDTENTAVRQAIQQAAAINQAYRTLKDPLLRAEYLLSLQRSLNYAERQTLHDPAFLMEQLALREALAEVTKRDALVEIAARIEVLNTRYYRQLTQAFTEEAWEQAADGLDKLKFLAKLRLQLSQLETALLGS